MEPPEVQEPNGSTGMRTVRVRSSVAKGGETGGVRAPSPGGRNLLIGLLRHQMCRILLVRGVSGPALVTDGYTTQSLRAAVGPRLTYCDSCFLLKGLGRLPDEVHKHL